MRYIETLHEGEKINEIYLCKQKHTFLNKSGKPYDSLQLQDKTGMLDAKIWDVSSQGIEEFDSLDYIEVTGDITSYQGSLQLNIKRVRRANEGEYTEADYLPVSKFDIEDMYRELTGYIETMENEHLKKLVSWFFIENGQFIKQFKTHSAAKTVHHAFVGGLLEHTLGVTRMCDLIAKNYPVLNRDLLVAAGMLHDIGKIEELTEFPANDYSDSGQLLGHIVIGAEWISRVIRTMGDFPVRLANELKHCILAHHGEYEFGSPKKPAIIEAVALHFADNIDAKMKTFQEALDAAPGDGLQWLGYNRLFESNIRRTSE